MKGDDLYAGACHISKNRSSYVINAFTKAGFYRAAVIPNMVTDRQNMPVDLAVMIKDVKPPLDEGYGYEL